MNNIDRKLLDKMTKSQRFRTELCRAEHYWFFHTYLSQYVTHDTAPFHKELFDITEDEDLELAVIAAFRGSAKSTIMCTSYPIWAMIGNPCKKFIVIISQTAKQAQLFLQNIKRQFETNELLIRDFGPFYEDSGEWQKGALVIPKYNTRIMAFSSEGNARGIMHLNTRPDLIICDDIESLQSVRTQEGRDKVSEWLFGDIIPMGVKDVKVIVIGNYLHEDCLIARLKEEISNGDRDGIYKEYPLYDENKRILWPGKYPDLAAIEKQERKINNPIAFQREYLLKIIGKEDQVIQPEWIRYYDQLPPSEQVRKIAIGVDLAISKKETANYTAIITAYVSGYGEDTKIYILPDIINKRMNFPETIEMIEAVTVRYKDKFYRVCIEDVAYQRAAIESLRRKFIKVEGIPLDGQDKLARLHIAAPYIKPGHVLFPKESAKVLIQQLVGFGSEKYDDLADAFSLLINYLAKDIRKQPPPLPATHRKNHKARPLTAGWRTKQF